MKYLLDNNLVSNKQCGFITPPPLNRRGR